MSTDDKNPYVGLRPFEAGESLLFFGREHQTLELLERLHRRRFLAVVGSSGCGKSSLLRAGLIPRLKAGYLVDDSDQWLLAIMKPGENPLYNLTGGLLRQVMSGATATDIEMLVKQVAERGVDALLDVLGPAWRQDHKNCFLLIDQFEELFRFAKGGRDTDKINHLPGDEQRKIIRQRDQAADFVGLLLELAAQSEIPVFVVISMRSDFIGDCTQFHGLPEALNESQYLVPRMGREDLRTAIESPARLYGGAVSPALTARVLNETGKVMDELPQLQHAMMRTWDAMQARQASETSIEDYEKVGTITGALDQDADEALRNLSSTDKLLAQKILQALTTIDEQGRRTRRPTHISELQALTGASEGRIMELVNTLNSDKRNFLVVNPTTDGKDTMIDITHESLIREWTILRHWVDKEGEAAANCRKLINASEEHRQKKKEYLTGVELALMRKWVNKFDPKPGWANRYAEGLKDALAYLEESKRHENRQKQKRRVLLASLAGMVVAFIFYAFITSKKHAQIIEKQYRAFLLHAKAQDAKDADPTLALRLQEAAISNLDAPMINDAAAKMYNENLFYKLAVKQSSPIYVMALSPDGQMIAAGSADNVVRLWTINGKLLHELRGHSGRINAIAFSKDGSKVLTGSKDKTARLWDTAGNFVHEFTGNFGTIKSVAFSSDGKNVLTCSDDGGRRWDQLGNMQQLFEETGVVRCGAFSQDGKFVLTGLIDNIVCLRELNGKSPKRFAAGGTICSVAFSPDGKYFVIGTSDSIKWFNFNGTKIGAVERETFDNNDSPFPIAFSSDAKQLLVGSGDGVAQLLAQNGEMIAELKGHVGDISSIVFSSDDRYIITAGLDGTVRKWDMQPACQRKIIVKEHQLLRAVFSPRGERILACGYGGAVLIDTTGLILKELGKPSDTTWSTAFSKDGQKVLTGSMDKVARLWDTSGTLLREFKGHTRDIVSVDFSSNGRDILTGSTDSTNRLWAINEKSYRKFKYPKDIMCSKFSTDGSQILTTSGDDTAQIVDLEGETKRKWNCLSNVTAISFSPDSRFVATGSPDGTCRLWDMHRRDTGGKLQQEFPGHSSSVRSVAFSPDGKTIAVGSDDVRLWDLKGNMIQRISVGSPVTSTSFSPNGKTLLTVSEDGILHTWRVMSWMDFVKTDHIEQLSDEQKKEYGIKIK